MVMNSAIYKLSSKGLKLCRVIISVITIGSFLFDAVFMDTAFAVNIIPAKAKTSQLRPLAAELELVRTGAGPGALGAYLMSGGRTEKHELISSLKDKTIETVRILGRSGRADVRPIIALARQIYPDFDPNVPEKHRPSVAAEKFVVLDLALMYQIYIPNNEIFCTTLIAPEPDILKWKIKPGSWQKQDYLKSKIWVAEGQYEGGYFTAGLAQGWFAIVDSGCLRKVGEKRYGELRQIFGMYDSPYEPLMIALIETSRLREEDFAEGIVVGHGRQEEIGHAQDISYAAQRLRRDFRIDTDAPEQTASEILRPGSPLFKRPVAGLAERLLNGKRTTGFNRRVKAITALEYSAKLRGIITEIKRHKADNRDELAFMAFLNFMDEQFLRSVKKKIPKIDVLALAYANVASRLFRDIDSWAGRPIDHTSTELIRILGMTPGKFPIEKALRMLEEIYEKHFWTDEERYTRLAAEPFKLAGPSLDYKEVNIELLAALKERCRRMWNPNIEMGELEKEYTIDVLPRRRLRSLYSFHRRPYDTVGIFRDAREEDRSAVHIGGPEWGIGCLLPYGYKDKSGRKVDLMTVDVQRCPPLIMQLADRRGNLYIFLAHIYRKSIDAQVRRIIRELKKRGLTAREVIFSPKKTSRYITAKYSLEKFFGEKIHLVPRTEDARALVSYDEGWVISSEEYGNVLGAGVWKYKEGIRGEEQTAAGADKNTASLSKWQLQRRRSISAALDSAA